MKFSIYFINNNNEIIKCNVNTFTYCLIHKLFLKIYETVLFIQ